MKKNTSNNLSKRLVQYGALSAAAFGIADANGQVTYVDIDPDQTLAVGQNFVLTVVDGSGDSNFDFNNPDGLANGNAAIVTPSAGAAFVGFTSGNYEYPSLLSMGDIVDDASGYTTDGTRGDLNYYGCNYANSQWCGDVNDGYLGIKFQFNGNTHYGWVRLDTDVNGDNLMVIKDYAFEATPDTAIEVGDEGLGIDQNAFEGFTYFMDENSNLNLKAATAIESVSVFNVLGQNVINKSLNANSALVAMDGMTSGVYIATVTIEGQKQSFKVIKK